MKGLWFLAGLMLWWYYYYSISHQCYCLSIVCKPCTNCAHPMPTSLSVCVSLFLRLSQTKKSKMPTDMGYEQLSKGEN